MTELASTSGREKGVPWRRELRVVDKNREENFTGPRFRRWNWMKQTRAVQETRGPEICWLRTGSRGREVR